jgi:hypothetical protein
MAASFNGTPSNIEFFDNIGIQLLWNGASPGGTIGVQVSVDFDPRFPTNATWTPLQTTPGTALTVSPGGTAGNAYLDLNQLSAPWVQVTYTTAGGSVGLLTSKITAKGLQ